jgi:hypothetical protein
VTLPGSPQNCAVFYGTYRRAITCLETGVAWSHGVFGAQRPWGERVNAPVFCWYVPSSELVLDHADNKASLVVMAFSYLTLITKHNVFLSSAIACDK